MKTTLCAIAVFVSATAAAAEVITTRYTCERGVEIPAVYINADTGEDHVVIGVEGGMFTLQQERSASGVRYGFPSDGSHYVWWNKGDTAMLLWHDGTTGDETTIYQSCEEQ